MILNLSGLAAGAATVGCCCNMIGFAVASFRENKFSGLLLTGDRDINAAGAQFIVRHPQIWIPPIPFQCYIRAGIDDGVPYDE